MHLSVAILGVTPRHLDSNIYKSPSSHPRTIFLHKKQPFSLPQGIHHYPIFEQQWFSDEASSQKYFQ